MIKFFNKKVPAGERNLLAQQSWVVRWSVNTLYRNNQAEFFTNEEDAIEFKKALIKATDLLKVDFYNSPQVSKNE